MTLDSWPSAENSDISVVQNPLGDPISSFNNPAFSSTPQVVKPLPGLTHRAHQRILPAHPGAPVDPLRLTCWRPPLLHLPYCILPSSRLSGFLRNHLPPRPRPIAACPTPGVLLLCSLLVRVQGPHQVQYLSRHSAAFLAWEDNRTHEGGVSSYPRLPCSGCRCRLPRLGMHARGVCSSSRSGRARWRP
ncbi:hypothetical protein EI94DRAFT_1746248 [Lactarius quietus]|nr:hypothetical protein EI94DRAFT_1746248 [Lactarius quietus]